jgi:hypothetical protein
MIVRIQLITQARKRVAIVAIPRLPEPPSVVMWCGRAFHRYAGGGRELRDDDIYRECSVAVGEEVE